MPATSRKTAPETGAEGRLERAASGPAVTSEFLHRPLFYGKNDAKTGYDLIEDVLAVSAHIEDFDHVINDCADRYFFTVLLLAGAIRNKINLLPANRTESSINALIERYHSTVLVTDDLEQTDGRAMQISGMLAPAEKPPPQAARAIPRIAHDQVIAIAYTSGSTGEPHAHPRTWRWAMQEALAAGLALGLDKNRPRRIICTTPPQHMYGFVSSVLMPLVLGQTSFRGRPFFPEEIREALSASGSESLLVTTPTQIRACIRSNARLPQPELILSSAAPLDRKMAERAEKTYLTRVVEFYGSTETGAIAIRQPVVEQSWETFRGVRVTSVNNELEVRADYLPGPVLVQDQVDIIDSRHFLLLGRSADLIKIGGKRESLARLNQTLLAMDGVEDGAFFVPETIGDREPRLAAVVVAPGLSVKDILSHLSHSIDAVFLPRPLKIVDALPRTTTGKLTRKALLALLKK